MGLEANSIGELKTTVILINTKLRILSGRFAHDHVYVYSLIIFNNLIALQL